MFDFVQLHGLIEQHQLLYLYKMHKNFVRVEKDDCQWMRPLRQRKLFRTRQSSPQRNNDTCSMTF